MPESQQGNEFNPPKLPFGWLASTFIAPVLVLVLPNVLTTNEIPFITRVAIALGVFSTMLIITCIMLTLLLYNTAFTQQSIDREIKSLRDNHERLTVEYREALAVATRQASEMIARQVDLQAKQVDLQETATSLLEQAQSLPKQ